MQTNIHEIADGVYRLATVIPAAAPGGFTFNQYLLDGDEPLLFHTGPRRMFPLVAEAAAKVLPLDRLRWVSFGHSRSIRRCFRAHRPSIHVCRRRTSCVATIGCCGPNGLGMPLPSGWTPP